MKKKPTTISDDEVCKLWLSRIVKNAEHLDGEADEGHDWHSLWTGFVLGLGRADLSDWTKYMELGFPLESQA